MTTPAIFGWGLADSSDASVLEGEQQFRKATLNMLLALAAARKALSGAPESFSREETGVVLATCHGELATTREFLRSLGTQGVARPFLFQNSLHHSTTGFVTIHTGITGPSVTVSEHARSSASALDLATLMLDRRRVKHCLVISVETSVSGLSQERDGAAAVLLGARQDEAPLRLEPLMPASPVDAVEALVRQCREKAVVLS